MSNHNVGQSTYSLVAAGTTTGFLSKGKTRVEGRLDFQAIIAGAWRAVPGSTVFQLQVSPGI